MLRNGTNMEENIASEQPATTILHWAEKGDVSASHCFRLGSEAGSKAANCTQRAVVRESSKNLSCGSQQAAVCGYETPPNLHCREERCEVSLEFGVLNFQYFASLVIGKSHFCGSWRSCRNISRIQSGLQTKALHLEKWRKRCSAVASLLEFASCSHWRLEQISDWRACS